MKKFQKIICFILTFAWLFSSVQATTLESKTAIQSQAIFTKDQILNTTKLVIDVVGAEYIHPESVDSVSKDLNHLITMHASRYVNNRSRYIKEVGEVLRRYGGSMHSYCLMTNHVHLLITPETESSISLLMKVLNSRFVMYMNKKYSRTGSIWEGRHKSSAIDSEQYLLRCYSYIELNPVRANMVESADLYPWSSIHSNAFGGTIP